MSVNALMNALHCELFLSYSLLLVKQNVNLNILVKFCSMIYLVHPCKRATSDLSLNPEINIACNSS